MGHFKPVETEYDLDRSFEPVKVRTLKCFRNAVQVSPFCLVELWLAIFWAVCTGFSFEEVFYASSRICSSVQNKEEPPACLFLSLQKVTMVLKTF